MVDTAKTVHFDICLISLLNYMCLL